MIARKRAVTEAKQAEEYAAEAMRKEGRSMLRILQKLHESMPDIIRAPFPRTTIEVPEGKKRERSDNDSVLPTAARDVNVFS